MQRVAEIEPARGERRIEPDGSSQRLARLQRTGQGIEGGAAKEVQFGTVGSVAQGMGGFIDDRRVVADGGQSADQVATGAGVGGVEGQDVPERVDRRLSLPGAELRETGDVMGAGFVGRGGDRDHALVMTQKY